MQKATKAQLKRRRVKRERMKPVRMAWRIYLKPHRVKEVIHASLN